MRTSIFQFRVRPSKIDGKGLFALSLIPKRKKIGQLNGEIISIAKARRIVKTEKRIAMVELDDHYALDASTKVDKFRYINHSCSPNAFMKVILHRVEFYALRNITVGEEITCNYGETHHEGKLRCNCHCFNCIGFL